MHTHAAAHKSPAKKKNRNAQRRRSSLEVTVKSLGMMASGRVHDISIAGAAIDLASPMTCVTGASIRLECLEFCFLEGKIRWQRNSRVGIEFDASTNAAAKLKAYFKFYHKDPKVETR
jgi:hypothetical protein